MSEVKGWVRTIFSLKRHYFVRGESHSLCGYHAWYNSLEQDLDRDDNNPRNCKACLKKLRKRPKE